MGHASNLMPQYRSYLSHPIAQTFYAVSHTPASSIEVSRLQHEKEFLECSLANCVTYLHALRKKLNRNEHRLATQPHLPRRKRKKLQQSKRELEREIKHREQDEQACLNNLQACKVNIYVAETLSCPSTGLLSAVPLFTSESTICSERYDLESPELIWDGWTDDVAMSPFHMRSRNPFDDNEVAPEDCSNKQRTDEAGINNIDHLRSVIRQAEGLGVVMPPTSTNTKLLEVSGSLLSPQAAAFEPYDLNRVSTSLGRQLEILNISTSMAIESLKRLQAQEVTGGGDTKEIHNLSFQARLGSGKRTSLTWCSPMSQQSPVNSCRTDGGLRRIRAKSF